MISAEYATTQCVCFLVGYLTSLQDLKKGHKCAKAQKEVKPRITMVSLLFLHNDPSTNVLCNTWYLLAGLPHSD